MSSTGRVVVSHHGARPELEHHFRGRQGGYRRYRRGDRGYVMVWFALMLITLFSFAGFSVDVASLWFTSQKVQKAADAAALAAAIFMPQDLSGGTGMAEKLAAENGYADGVSGYTTNATVVVTQEPNPYRVRVRISFTAKTYFAVLMGVKQVTLTREAVAEYQGPVPMGSPTNNIGNQPVGSGQYSWNASSPADIANTNPQVWANIAGAATNKANGDRFATSYCTTTNTYACEGGTTNTEYTTNGYFYTISVKVAAADLSKYLMVQAYDPAFVQQGDYCNDFDGDGASAYNGDGSVNDADEVTLRNQLVALNVDRYRNPSPYTNQRFNTTYCTGDHFIRSGQGLPTTYMQFREPDLTPWNSMDNPVISTSGCSQSTFTPIAGAGPSSSSRLPNLLNTTNTSTQAVYARRVYHQWYDLCKIPLASIGITTAGTHDVILNVRTGTTGAGHNRYSLRAGLSTTLNNTSAGLDGSKTQVFAAGRLPLYANAAGADSRFYLARLLPGNAGRTLSIQLFDIGDAGDVGTLQILPPDEATRNGNNFDAFSGCSFSRYPAGGTALSTTPNTCTVSQVRSSNGYDGRMMIVNVPVPSGYSCNEASSFGCWVKVKFAYGSGVDVTDTTTWSANILGDPVRLIE